MKKIFFYFVMWLCCGAKVSAQCDLGNFLTAYLIPQNAYPYTNIGGVTVSASLVNVTSYPNFTYTCGPNSFAGANPTWGLTATNQSITLTFSVPVCNFTVLVNGTNTTEEFYFTPNNGTVNLINFCTTNFMATGGGTSLLCIGAPATGTIITVDNPAGATQYVMTHNGLGAGSRYTLLDCYVACNVVPPANQITCSIPNLSYCVGENTTVDYIATGTYLPGNIFTAELSDPFGSFAAPVVIGSIAATVSGTIPVTIPLAALNGSGYRVRVTSTNPPVTGANNGVNFSIHQLPSVTANATPPSVCAGGNLTLTGGGAATYLWTGGVTNGVAFVPPATNTYTVTGTDIFNCINTASVTVSVNPLPVVTAAVNPINTVCAGTPVTLSGGGAVNYTWTPPAINNVAFTPLTTAIYTVTGTDANGCTNTSSILITVNPAPNIIANANPLSVCMGGQTTLTGSGGNNYTWTGGVVNGVPFTPLVTTTYTVTGTDANGCTNTSSVTVLVNTAPNITANATPVNVCVGGQTVLTGGGGVSYTWSGGITDGVAFTPLITNTYTVTGTDAGGCTNTSSITVFVNALPIVSANAAPANVCIGSPTTLTGSGAVNYVWTAPVIDNVAFVPAVTATYTVTGTDAIGCSGTSTIQVIVNPLPVISISVSPNDTLCAGNPVTLTASGATNYSWSGGVQNGVAFVPPATNNYTVTATDINNCSTTLTQLITLTVAPVVNLGPDVNLCAGDQVVLDATNPNSTYLWQDGSQNAALTANQTGLYWVIVNNGACIDADSVMVTVNQYPVIDLGPDNSFCEGGSFLLDATCPGCTYLWDNNSTQATQVAIQEGTYIVTVTNAGCSATDSIFLDQVPLPVVSLGADTAICPGDKVKLDAYAQGASYLWQDNSKLSYFNLSNVGTYWVEVTVGPCTGRDEIKVTYSERCECPLIVPNAFSPNGDMLNDEFRLINTQFVDIVQYSIYNRWGQEVYSSKNPDIGWEGNFNGTECDMGTYHYVIRYKCLYSGKDYVLKGDITLVR